MWIQIYLGFSVLTKSQFFSKVKHRWDYLGTKTWFRVPFILFLIFTFPVWIFAVFLLALLLIVHGLYVSIADSFWPKPSEVVVIDTKNNRCLKT